MAHELNNMLTNLEPSEMSSSQDDQVFKIQSIFTEKSEDKQINSKTEEEKAPQTRFIFKKPNHKDKLKDVKKENRKDRPKKEVDKSAVKEDDKKSE